MQSRQTRNVSLTPELEGFITDCLGSGDYANASEVVRAGLRSLRDGSVRPVASAAWPPAGGDCGALVRERDWSQTPLGPISAWSRELRATVSTIVNSPVAKVLMWGPDYLLLYNDAYCEIVGHRHPAIFGTPVATALPEVWEWNRHVLEAGFRGDIVSHRDQQVVMQRPEGPATFYMDLFYTPVYDADGQVAGVMCTVLDNSARVRAEQRLATSEAELRSVTDAVPLLISYLDRDHVYRFANSAYEDWFGTAPATMVGRHVRDVVGDAFYEDRRASFERGLAGEAFSTEAIAPHRDGPRKIEVRYVPRIEADGSIPGLYVLGIDIEDRARREAELAVSNKRFRAAMDAVHGVLWTNSADGRMLGEQPGWAALTGQNFDDYQGYGWTTAVHPDDVAPTLEAWETAVASKAMFVGEHRVRQREGFWRSFAIRALPLTDAGGSIIEWVGVHTDITHRRAAEAALRQQAETLARQVRHRERAEDQLRHLNETLEARVIAEIEERQKAEAKLVQAQKMEAIGKLTGGVAHDFNNLLQVVSGNLQLLAKDIAGNERAERRVTNAMAGVSRGSKLASQLLAFGRRQALEPKVVNVTRFVRGMDDLLRRAIGEGVEMETIFGGGLWNTFVDPVQIENAVLNLAINARDAMDGVGKLTVELANTHLDDDYARTHEEVTPGQYVMLAVSDTGCGMPPEVVAKAFEPFFSTKSEGKGSGLGLSMVYGFVKQSGGHVKIYSEPGHGTTIRLYLPRAVEAEDVEVAVDTGPIQGGSETVLVVEDDAEVRATVVEILSDLGYRVLKAVDATSALHVVESGIPIDLLFTDVVMPGQLKSPELARRASERLPDIAVLFTSGYTENSIVHGGRLDAGLELLSKPYTREALARKIRHVLANQKQRRQADSAVAQPSVPPAAVQDGLLPRVAGNRALTVLLVEDDALIRTNTAEMLKDAGFVVMEAGSAEDAMIALQTAPVDVLVTDVNLPGASGPDLAARARILRPTAAVIYATGDVSSVVAGDRTTVLAKPYDAEALLRAVGLHAPTSEPDDGDADASTYLATDTELQ